MTHATERGPRGWNTIMTKHKHGGERSRRNPMADAPTVYRDNQSDELYGETGGVAN